ncbi:putative MGM101-mitochondrial genome maintenance protein [Fusarium austroafricanum]|uniref:Mitochondrial genome maintenance protein MGM101 n=1 Tax=Fusarium austroafricanum TaxID=2364996 RepID=A0A8H4NUE6_9HYPO|nr:putative MGM101-mitochondrial genome maintenance protein [Fusarium austroafricanum]
MFVPRRALFATRRLPISIRPIARYYSTADAAAQDVAQENQEDVAVKPKYTPRARAATAKPSVAKPVTKTATYPTKPATATATTTTTAASKAPSLANPHQAVSTHKNTLSESSETDFANTHEINWETSWYGLGVKPVTPEQSEVLARPLDPEDVEVKPDGIVYLPEVKYRRRLNEAFGPMGWGMVHRGEVVVGNNIVTREYALIINGRMVSQSQGVNNYFSTEGIPAAIEGAKSNALMRCCKDLGIASELWDPVFLRWFRKNFMEERWVEHATTKKKRTFWYRKGLAEAVYPYKFV